MSNAPGQAARRSPEPNERQPFARLHSETYVGLDLFGDAYYDEAVRKVSQRFVNRVKELAGRPDLDGTALMEQAFSAQQPLLAFNERETLLERDVHDGYRFLAVGLTRAVRNVLTHRDSYGLSRIEAWEWLAFVSAMHRLLDEAQQVTADLD